MVDSDKKRSKKGRKSRHRKSKSAKHRFKKEDDHVNEENEAAEGLENIFQLKATCNRVRLSTPPTKPVKPTINYVNYISKSVPKISLETNTNNGNYSGFSTKSAIVKKSSKQKPVTFTSRKLQVGVETKPDGVHLTRAGSHYDTLRHAYKPSVHQKHSKTDAASKMSSCMPSSSSSPDGKSVKKTSLHKQGGAVGKVGSSEPIASSSVSGKKVYEF